MRGGDKNYEKVKWGASSGGIVFLPSLDINCKLTESTSRSSKSWEKSISRFGLSIVDQFEWWLIFVVEIRVLIVCLRSELRLVLIDIFSVRIRCAGPIRNLYFMLFYVRDLKYFTFPKRSDFEKGWYGMFLNFSGSWHGPQPVGLSWMTGEMNSAMTGTNYDLNKNKSRDTLGLGTAVLEVQSATKWSRHILVSKKLEIKSW